jgi:hypothetical protein
MNEKEIIENLKTKLKDATKIVNLSSKNFRFKGWHAGTITLLRKLPPGYKLDINDFKKLTFEDTKYRRGNKFFNPGDNAKYTEDINMAVKILKKIISSLSSAPKGAPVKQEKKAAKPAVIKKTKPAAKGKSPARPGKTKIRKSPSKPVKPAAKKKPAKASKASSRKTGVKSSKKPKK